MTPVDNTSKSIPIPVETPLKGKLDGKTVEIVKMVASDVAPEGSRALTDAEARALFFDMEFDELFPFDPDTEE